MGQAGFQCAVCNREYDLVSIDPMGPRLPDCCFTALNQAAHTFARALAGELVGRHMSGKSTLHDLNVDASILSKDPVTREAAFRYRNARARHKT